ncbi:hypothetical protein GGI03_008720, partial [Coemansia sp. RSA 2337]
VNSASHVVPTVDMPVVMAKGNPNINYVWGVTDTVKSVIANTTMLVNPNKGVVPPPPPPPPAPPAPPAPSAPSAPSSSSTSPSAKPTQSSSSTIVRKCIPRPTPK